MDIVLKILTNYPLIFAQIINPLSDTGARILVSG